MSEENSEFLLSLEAMPRLSEAGEASVPRRASPRPTVTVFPYLSEQGSHGQKSALPAPRILEVPSSFEALFPGVRVLPIEPLHGKELEFQGSSLSGFLQRAWSHLLPYNVLVTHRNFLANEVLSRASAQRAGKIPNAAILRLTVRRRGEPETKTIFFLRHCTSHNNAARKGNGLMTTCADVSSFARVAAALRRECGSENVLFGSSILPRAILSSIALQIDVSDEELERVRLKFQPEAKARREEVSAYQRSHACSRVPGQGAYCDGAQGTFILGPKRSGQ